MSPSVPCSRAGCRRFTRHSSRRCHDHRGDAPPTTFLPATPPPGFPTSTATGLEQKYENGILRVEIWRIDGVTSRVNGPALRRWNRDGSILDEVYALDFVIVRGGLPAIVKKLEAETDVRLRERFAKSELAPLIDEGVPPRTILGALGEGITTVTGVRAIAEGSPVEWVRAWESSNSE